MYYRIPQTVIFLERFDFPCAFLRNLTALKQIRIHKVSILDFGIILSDSSLLLVCFLVIKVLHVYIHSLYYFSD